jgi:hypothetical protein
VGMYGCACEVSVLWVLAVGGWLVEDKSHRGGRLVVFDVRADSPSKILLHIHSMLTST